MPLAAARSFFFMAVIASVGIACVLFYLERIVGLTPCPLCLLQRFFLLAFAVTCLAAALRRPSGAGLRRYAAGALVFALAGAGAATRQLWLQAQMLHADLACHPDLLDLARTLSWPDFLQTLLLGNSQCARINWTLLDMSLPEWSLLAFTGMACFALWQLVRRNPRGDQRPAD